MSKPNSTDHNGNIRGIDRNGNIYNVDRHGKITTEGERRLPMLEFGYEQNVIDKGTNVNK